jgi:TonB family protein
MTSFALPRGQGPAYADLPPTLQPHIITAPPTDRLRTISLSGLVYLTLLGAGIAISSLAPRPLISHVRDQPPGRTVVIEHEPTLLRVIPSPGITTATGGGGETVTAIRTPAPAEVPSEPAKGFSTEDHSGDKMGTGIGPVKAGAPSGTGLVGTGVGPGTAPLDLGQVGLTVLHQVEPIYPDIARRARIQGLVVLLMTVNEQGIPIQVQVMEGHPAFHDVAVRAARQWRFEPARMSGLPVSAVFRLTLKFSLR